MNLKKLYSINKKIKKLIKYVDKLDCIIYNLTCR